MLSKGIGPYGPHSEPIASAGMAPQDEVWNWRERDKQRFIAKTIGYKIQW